MQQTVAPGGDFQPGEYQSIDLVAATEGNDNRQAPAYLDGILTVRLLRPFLRRRLSTARPHFVSILALKPCFLILLLLRGRYVGLPIYAFPED
jgi:hypothetical protein